jgi:hypothetical protein
MCWRFQMQRMYAMTCLPNTCRLVMDDFKAGRQVEQDWHEPCQSSWRMSKLEKSKATWTHLAHPGHDACSDGGIVVESVRPPKAGSGGVMEMDGGG